MVSEEPLIVMVICESKSACRNKYCTVHAYRLMVLGSSWDDVRHCSHIINNLIMKFIIFTDDFGSSESLQWLLEAITAEISKMKQFFDLKSH